MRFWGPVCLALVAGCYQPTLHEGAPCGAGATCPVDQECRAGTCFFTTTPADAAREPGIDAADIDASMIAMVDAPPDGPPYVAWSTPVVNASLELAQSGEDDPSVTANKLTVVLAATEVVAPISTNLFIGTRTAVDQPFTVTALTALNTDFDEGSPEISADGQTIWFTSDQGGVGHDVYVSTFAGGAWSAPTVVTELSIASNGDVAISPDGLTALVLRDAAQAKMYLHTRATTTATWGTGVELTALEIAVDIAAPSITNGAQTIYFHAGQPRDIYVSHKVGGVYQTPTPVSELNTTARESGPFVNQADNYMIFSRAGDIYETTR